MFCFVPLVRGCVWYVCCYVRKKARISSLEYELQRMKAKATRSIDGLDELEQYSRLNSGRIQHPQWVESPTENCVSLVIDYAKRNNINLIPGDFCETRPH